VRHARQHIVVSLFLAGTAALIVLAPASCSRQREAQMDTDRDKRGKGRAASSRSPVADASAPSASPEEARRHAMVRTQLERRDVKDARVLAAMKKVPRHLFVPPGLAIRAYEDRPFPIGHGQTISQPFIVAFMTEALRLRGHEKVLEIGTGSGYQAAILGELAKDVFSIEIVAPLARSAQVVLTKLAYENVHVRAGDGYLGWPEHAPYGAILLTAAPAEIPKPLTDQLAEGGVLVAPVGDSHDQTLVRITKKNGALVKERLIPVRFVPMTGAAQDAGAPSR